MDMNNEIDKKIYGFIQENYPHPFATFQARFNSGADDAVEVFRNVHAIYGRYMTRDYCKIMLGLTQHRIEKALNQKAV
jgi:hypothetical protein